jgi:hypothetical protein
MWIATTQGFYSAVQHRDDSNLMMIRARSYEDMVQLVDLDALDGQGVTYAHIIELNHSDYRFRVLLTREQWNRCLLELSSKIEYDNFKDAVKKRSVNRARIYMKVWTVLLAIEDERWAPRHEVKDPAPGRV